jgi:PAS domain S-box-containing protein
VNSVIRSLRGVNLRLLAVVVVVATTFAVAAAAMAYRHCQARALADVRSSVDGLMDAAATSAAIGAYANDRNLLQEVVDNIGQNPLVAHVDVVSPSGEVLASHDAVTDGPVPREPAPSMTAEHPLHSPFDSEVPVGSMRVRADPTSAEAIARSETARVAILLLGQMALVAALLCAVIARFIAQPIVRVGRALRVLHPGSSERLKIPARHAHDEIGGFIRGANELLRSAEHVLKRERQSRAEMTKAEARYRQMFESIGAGTFVLDLGGRLLENNAATLEIIGLPKSVLPQLRADDFIRQAFVDPDRVRQIIHEASQRREAVSTELELRPRGRSVRWVHCLLSVRNQPGATPLIDGLIVDITARKLAVMVVVNPPTVRV